MGYPGNKTTEIGRHVIWHVILQEAAAVVFGGRVQATALEDDCNGSIERSNLQATDALPHKPL